MCDVLCAKFTLLMTQCILFRHYFSLEQIYTKRLKSELLRVVNSHFFGNNISNLTLIYSASILFDLLYAEKNNNCVTISQIS